MSSPFGSRRKSIEVGYADAVTKYWTAAFDTYSQISSSPSVAQVQSDGKDCLGYRHGKGHLFNSRVVANRLHLMPSSQTLSKTMEALADDLASPRSHFRSKRNLCLTLSSRVNSCLRELADCRSRVASQPTADTGYTTDVLNRKLNRPTWPSICRWDYRRERDLLRTGR